MKENQIGRRRGESIQQDLCQPGLACGNVLGLSYGRSFLAAVDEQNAQTQEQEMIVLGLSESEEKKDLKSEDTVCHSESCGVAKHRSLRKGTATSRGALSPAVGPGTQKACQGSVGAVLAHCSGHLQAFPCAACCAQFVRWQVGGVLGSGEPWC